MANFEEPTEELKAGWAEWVASRPPIVRAICEKIEPWKLYQMKDTKQYVTFYSCSEDGTITVDVSSEWNGPITIDRRVFGVDPAVLVECDLPGPDDWMKA